MVSDAVHIQADGSVAYQLSIVLSKVRAGVFHLQACPSSVPVPHNIVAHRSQFTCYCDCIMVSRQV
mgnify:CR=1 FL=1